MKANLHFKIFIFSLLTSLFAIGQTTYRINNQNLYTWNDAIEDWSQYGTFSYHYDNGGSKETRLVASNFPEGQTTYQFYKVYNEINNIVSSEGQSWDAQNSAWLNEAKVGYQYNASNAINFTDIQYYNQDLMVYEDISRQYITYEGDNVTMTIDQEYDTVLSEWQNKDRYTYIYNSQNLLETIHEYQWNTVSSMWEVTIRNTFMYDTNDLLVETLIEYESNNSWIETKRIYRTYIGLLEVEVLNTFWNLSIGEWENSTKELSTYDSNGNKTIFIIEDWNPSNSTWNLDYKEEYTYEEAVSLSVADVNKMTIKMYPNPVKDIINIELNDNDLSKKTISIYGIDGKLLMSTFSKPNDNLIQLNLEALKSGIYFLRIGSSEVKRIIKE
ncbi:MAG: T9SS type A sorting domain-containing protein [Psychroserpens sp.]|uniref:T9SS type A sorting domain-containing protein n=1 Tax=Psychroserpens sp. TaxID=2020870 RepID=UPI003CB55884